jgi:hypothetical protein
MRRFLIRLVQVFALAIIGAGLYSIAVVMTYHDLRAAKEGTDIEQIAWRSIDRNTPRPARLWSDSI